MKQTQIITSDKIKDKIMKAKQFMHELYKCVHCGSKSAERMMNQCSQTDGCCRFELNFDERGK